MEWPGSLQGGQRRQISQLNGNRSTKSRIIQVSSDSTERERERKGGLRVIGKFSPSKQTTEKKEGTHDGLTNKAGQ